MVECICVRSLYAFRKGYHTTKEFYVHHGPWISDEHWYVRSFFVLVFVCPLLRGIGLLYPSLGLNLYTGFRKDQRQSMINGRERMMVAGEEVSSEHAADS